MVLKRISVCLSVAFLALTGNTEIIWAQQCESQPVTAGYRDYNFDSGSVNSEPTEEKPESKLWYTDSSWWGIMWDPEAEVFSIHRFDRDNQCWTAVGPGSDDRGRTSQDAYWDESIQKLYLASHGKPTIPAGEDQSARLYRYTYNSGADSYTLDAGFPVNINGERSRSLVITKESTGKLWASWTSNQRVMVNSATNDGANWGIPFELPGQGNDLKADANGKTIDISSTISFNGDRIGVFWGNQLDKKYYFMVHVDGDADAIWQPREVALQGFFGNAADDHINLACPSDHSTVIGVVKSDINGGTNPLIRVVKRDLGTGVWTASTFGIRSENHTRPALLVDSDTDSIYVFAKSSVAEPEAIYYKVAHVDNLNFPSGLGRLFMSSDVEDNINNPTSTKQNVNANTGLLVLASNKQNKRYMHNFLALGGNHAPVAVDDVTSTPQNTPESIVVTANDTDEDNAIDVTTVQLVDSTSNGALSIDAVTGIVTYTPASGFLGTDSFRYAVRDQNGESTLAATVTITVHVNSLPVAQNDSDSTDEEKAVTIDVLGNDSDSDGVVIVTTVQIVSTPTNGFASVVDSTGEIIYAPNTDFEGTDAFSYSVNDNSGGTSNAATVTVTVADINDAPVAINDAVVTDEETPIAIDVTLNDSDIDGVIDVSTVSVISPATDGNTTVNVVTGEVNYTPNQDFVGADTFTYTVNDEDSATSNEATVSVTVNPINDLPVAAPDTAVTDEDQFVAIAVLSNDSDVDGTIVPSTLSIVSQPSNGSVSVNTVNGLITYTPNAGFNGADSFDYTVDDNQGAASQPGTVTVIVNDINDPPVASDDAAATSEDIPRVVDVLTNDNDSDGTLDPASVTIITDASNGATSVNTSTGEITYSPNFEFSGDDSFTYTVNDDDGASSNEATVTIEIGGINDAPVAVADQVVTPKGSAVDIDVTANDTDVDGTVNPATVAPTAALNGTIAVLSGGLVRYTPNAGFSGNDSFTYTVRDDLGLTSNEATVSVKVNNSPIAVNDNAFTHEDSAVVIQVLANDVDADGTFDQSSVVITSSASNGTTSINTNSGEVTYRPGVGFSGTDSFNYSVLDNDGAISNSALVSVSINDRPDAVADAGFTNPNSQVTIAVLANDSDSDGSIDPATVAISAAPVNGSATVDVASGQVTYTPNPDFSGASDNFSYTVQDNEGGSSGPTNVTVDVNAFPVAANDAVSMDEDTNIQINVLANDSDADGSIDPTSVVIVVGPAQGNASVNGATGTITYTPSPNFFGADSLTYTVRDNNALTSFVGTVIITVADVNEAPVAVDDNSATAEETPAPIAVTANDTDIDGVIDPTTVAIVVAPGSGSLNVDTGTGAVTYTPNKDFVGTDTFTYTVKDNDGGQSNVATVTVTVSGENDPPVAVADLVTTDEDVAVEVDVVANDSDIDGSIDPTTVSVVAEPGNGTVVVSPVSGAITYTPALDFFGADTLLYNLRDNNGFISNTARVIVTVSDVNDAPVAVDDSGSTTEESALTIDVASNDTDKDGTINPILVAVASQPSNGSATVEAGGDITYLPGQNFEGSDSFTYTVADDDGGVSNAATVTVNVSGESDPPVAIDDAVVADEEVPLLIDVASNDRHPDVGGTVDATTVTLVSSPTRGTATVDPTTGLITYVSNVDFSGADSFTYTIDDNAGRTSNVATVSITVNPVNDAPIAQNDEAVAGATTPVVIDVLANDSGTDGVIDPTTVSIVSPPFNGTTSIDPATGAVTYTANAGFSGGDGFLYAVADNNGLISNSATVNINVSGRLLPTDDSFVRSTKPGRNYGDGDVLRVRTSVNGARQIAYLKFNVSGIDAPVVSAKVFLFVVDGSDKGGSVFVVSNNFQGENTPWSETELVFNNAPDINGNPIVNIGPVTAGQTVEIDLLSVITGNGIYSLAIRSDSEDPVEYNQKGQPNPPALIIEVAPRSAFAPTISAFTPTSGPAGTEVTITGANLSTTTEVRFGGQAAGSFEILSDAQVRVAVPGGATSGKIGLTNAESSTSSAGDFSVIITPTISSIAPGSGPIGTEVTLEGAGFTGVTEVTFNGTPANSFDLDSDNRIRAQAPFGATSGPIGLTNPAGAVASTGNFTILQTPTIAAFNPSSGPLATEVTITGTNFVEVTNVNFNGVAAAGFTVNSDSELRAVAPSGGSSGPISVSNPAGTATSASSFDLLAPPTITSFAPAGGLGGTEVTINGSSFSDANDVLFNGVSAASFTVDSDTQIRAGAPASVVSGPIRVTNSIGTGISATNFVASDIPNVSAFSPLNGSVGDEVTISGSNFFNATDVRFNGTLAAGFSVDSNTRIRVSVPNGATSGKIRIGNVAGGGESVANFIIAAGPSTLTFNPTDDSFVRSNRATSNYGDGDVLRARRSNSGTDQIAYLKFAVTGITGSVESARIRLLVRTESPQGGSIFAVSNNFLGSNNPWNEEEIVFANAPGLSGPALGSLGAVNFGQTVEFDVTSAIAGNGVFSFAISTTSDDVVEYAPKEIGNAPELVIEQSGGAPPNAPTISAFSPASGVSGTEVTIFGNNFSGATDVFFNGISATSFSIDTNSQIRAVVGPGATSGRVGVSSPDGTGLSATDFAIVGPPSISFFTPASGSAGTEVTITGSNFTGVTAVGVSSVLAANFTIDSDTRLRLTVPVGASTGPIDATNAAGTGTSVSSFTVALPPAVSAFTPSSGPAGTEVTLAGSNLAAITNVFFNGVAAASFTIDSNSQVRAVVASSATTGPVSVTNAAGTGISTNSFSVLGPPVVTSFSPAGGTLGIELTVFGGNFDGVTSVAFNGVPATGFTLDSPTLLRTTVPSGATSGPVSVTNNLGTGISATNFVVTPVPTVSTFSPLTGSVDTEVTITGGGFSNVTNVEFGVAQAVGFTIDSATQIRANVPAGATSGPIRATNISGTGTSSASFIVTAGSSTLTFDSIDDAYVRSNRANDNFGAGTLLRVRRSASGVEQFSYIKFDITGITGTVESAKLRLFVVDPGPQGGAAFSVSNNWDENSITFSNAPGIGGAPIISVGEVTAGQTLEFDFTDAISGNGVFSCAIKNSSDDAVEYASSDVANGPQLVIEQSGGISPNAPVITAFSPAGGVSGTEVTIVGSNFSGTTNVFFNNLSASSFSVDSNTQIRAVVAGGTTTGLVGVSTANGTGLSVTNFVLVSPPTISSFSPLSGPAGVEVTLNGSNFSGTLGVSFNGLFASTFTVDTDSRLRVSVPTGASTGAVIVENAAGAGTSNSNFSVTLPPVVTSFTPTSGSIGTVVTITGTNFSSATGVSFNGAATSTFSVDSATRIRASVPSGAGSGAVGVSNVAGTGISSSPFQVLAPPAITSFSPAGGQSGVEVTIFGTNLDGVASLAFNGTPASGFTVDSGSLIRATVSNGASTGPISATNNIGTGTSSTNFVVTPPPGVISFTPLTGSVGTEVTITGNNFLNAASVAFGVTPSSGFSIDSDSQVRATVPVGATSGQISVSNISGNGSSAASFIVISGPSTLTFQPTDDSYVRSNKPDRNSGAGDILRVRESSSGVLQASYLKFNVTGVIGEVERATLRLFVEDGGTEVGSIFSVSNNWDENTITFNNAPEIAGNPLQSLGGIATGQTLEFDVSAAISDNGVFSFAIRNDRDDAVEFASKEIAHAPELVLDQSGGSSGDAPAISAFSPAGGVVGTEVTVVGNFLLGATDVFFNNISAASFTVDSNTQIRAVVGAGTTSGKIGINSSEGTGLSATDFVLVNPPAITFFSPASGPIGTEVTVIGSSFTGAAEVRLNNVVASDFSVDSDSRLRVAVPAGSSTGMFSISNAAGTSTSTAIFTVIAAPVVSGFDPQGGPVGAEVTVTGSNFITVTAVSFNGVPAPGFTVQSNSQIKVNVPFGASSGLISVSNTGGNGASAGSFEVQAPPAITSVTPAFGVAGTEVTVNGSNFLNATAVNFNGSPAASFNVTSGNQIRATAATGVTTGPVSIANSVGTAISSTNFSVVLLPTVSSFTPTNGPAGTEVTIIGTNLLHGDQVSFNGFPTAGFIADSETQLRVSVPVGASKGLISVSNAAGTGTSINLFTVTDLPSAITLNPTDDVYVHSGKPDRNHVQDDHVRVRKTNSSDLIAYLKFNITGLNGAPESATLRLFVQDASNDGGAVFKVSNDFQGVASPWNEENLVFNNAPEPSGSAIAALGPVNANQTVEFDVTAAIDGSGTYSFAISNASDDLLIYSANGSANPPELFLQTNGGPTTAPTLSSFFPTTGAVATEITLTGFNFTGVSQVEFNGTAASDFSVDSDTRIRAVPQVGTSTGKIGISSPSGSGFSTENFVILLPPVITSFSPVNAQVGAEVTINGSSFNGVSSVLFNNTSASFIVDTSIRIRAIVPSAATQGRISVTNPDGTGVSVNEFAVSNAPVVISFNPLSAAVGAEITITGVNFTGATSVAFNEIAASTFVVDTDAQVRATIPAGASTGKVRVTDSDGSSLSANDFVVITTPAISSFTPASGQPGTEVTLAGSGFAGVTAVAFNGIAASGFTLDSDTQLRASVPAGASNGPITLSNVAGTDTSSTDFDIPTDAVSLTFSPIADAMVRSDAGGDNFGDGVILRARLTGSGAQHRGYMKFDVTGLGTVVSAKIRLVVVETSSDGGSLFSVSNDFSGTTTPWTETGITFDNAPGLEGGALGTLGAITIGQTVEFDVTSAVEADGVYGFALSSASNDAAIFHSKEGTDSPELLIETVGGVIVPTPPVVTSFSPSAGPIGTEVTITGSNLDNTTAVSFNSVVASSFSVISESQVRALVPAAATSGSIRISNPDGTGTSANAFSVLLPPSITSFSPGNGPVGAEVTISGTNFSALTDISFNGTSAESIDLDSDTQVRARVPNGASTGPITVSNSVGNSTSSGDFTITTIPGIASFTPTSGVAGAEITITGSNFSGASAVSFSGVSATSFTVDSDSRIRAEVPSGAATGKIIVTNGDGTGSSNSDFAIVAVPTITFFSPASGAPGSEVTIFGTNFVGITEIIFNGAPATSITFDSDTRMRANVPAGGTSGPISITNAAGTVASATNFEVSSGGGPFSFLATEDTYVRSSRPTTTYGNNADLKVRKASTADRNVYLKFTISGVTGTVESVKIRLACTDGSQEGGSIISVSNNFIGSGTAWTEEALAWENAPAIAGTPLVTLGFVTTGQIVEFDVTAAVAGDGTYSFAIVNNTSDLANYSSKESATSTPPVLVITTESGLTKRTSDTETASEDASTQAEELLPDDPTLLPNYPNPFNIETTIQYALPAETKVKLRIFNLRGQVVRVLVDEVQKAGIKRISWNGRNAKKKVVATGVYFVRLEVGGLKLSRKITLQK